MTKINRSVMITLHYIDAPNDAHRAGEKIACPVWEASTCAATPEAAAEFLILATGWAKHFLETGEGPGKREKAVDPLEKLIADMEASGLQVRIVEPGEDPNQVLAEMEAEQLDKSKLN